MAKLKNGRYTVREINNSDEFKDLDVTFITRAYRSLDRRVWLVNGNVFADRPMGGIQDNEISPKPIIHGRPRMKSRSRLRPTRAA